MDHDDTSYRNLLVALEHKSQDSYDKTVLALAGGALAISFSFLENVVSLNSASHLQFLFLAWTFWTVSLASVLASYFSSSWAMRRAVVELDENSEASDAELCGTGDTLTVVFNVSAGAFFLVGLILMGVFVGTNLRSG